MKKRKKIGTIDIDLSKRVYDYLNIGDYWLHTEFYTEDGYNGKSFYNYK